MGATESVLIDMAAVALADDTVSSSEPNPDEDMVTVVSPDEGRSVSCPPIPVVAAESVTGGLCFSDLLTVPLCLLLPLLLGVHDSTVPELRVSENECGDFSGGAGAFSEDLLKVRSEIVSGSGVLLTPV
jgi:hypothetical protein